jgi:hypothetical protein
VDTDSDGVGDICDIVDQARQADPCDVLAGDTVSNLRFPDGKFKLTWDAPASDPTPAYDVIWGSLNNLRESASGNYAAGGVLFGCLENDSLDREAEDNSLPASLEGVFYLVRPVCPESPGTYDSTGPNQHHPRDAEILAAGLDCVN